MARRSNTKVHHIVFIIVRNIVMMQMALSLCHKVLHYHTRLHHYDEII